jgi:hypothetical protein
MQYGEVYSALQTHIVDGQENPISQVEAGKLYEVQKYVSMTNHVWDGYCICCNAAAWHRVPPDLQAITAQSFNDVAPLLRADVAKLNESDIKLVESKGMVSNDTTPDTFRAQLRQAGFYSDWRKKMGEDAWGLLEKYAGKVSDAHQGSELTCCPLSDLHATARGANRAGHARARRAPRLALLSGERGRPEARADPVADPARHCGATPLRLTLA